jgi:hypothetical protein
MIFEERISRSARDVRFRSWAVLGSNSDLCRVKAIHVARAYLRKDSNRLRYLLF